MPTTETWFKAVTYWQPSVETVEVENETAKFVIIRGRREAKVSENVAFFRDELEAWEYVREIFRIRLKAAKKKFESAKAICDEIDEIFTKKNFNNN